MPELTRRGGVWTEAFDCDPEDCDHPDGLEPDGNLFHCPHCGHAVVHRTDTDTEE
jgi:hypothetical protein